MCACVWIHCVCVYCLVCVYVGIVCVYLVWGGVCMCVYCLVCVCTCGDRVCVCTLLRVCVDVGIVRVCTAYCACTHTSVGTLLCCLGLASFTRTVSRRVGGCALWIPLTSTGLFPQDYVCAREGCGSSCPGPIDRPAGRQQRDRAFPSRLGSAPPPALRSLSRTQLSRSG